MTGALAYDLISADSHVLEPGDLFATRLPAKLRDRAPQLAPWNGGSAWMVDGVDPVPLPLSGITGSGYRLPDHGDAVAFDELLPALHDPVARLRSQDADSVSAEVIYGYPYLWDAIKQLEDSELRLNCAGAYNDWIAEFCAHEPTRLIGIARIPVAGIDEAHREMVRCVEDLGLKGFVFDAWPTGSGGGMDPDLDALWEVAAQADVPITLHYGFGDSRSAPTAAISPGVKPPASAAMLPLASSGVFDRFPTLRMVLAHADAGWTFHWMEFLDNTYQRQRHLEHFTLPNPDVYPSEYLRRHFWFTVHQDRTAITNRQMFGIEHLMWASHFPLDVSDWPDNRQQAMRVTEELPLDDRRAILAENAARLYRLPGYEDGVQPAPFDSIERLIHV